MDKTVAVFQKNKFQDVHVSIREYKGEHLIDIRCWTMNMGSDDKIPTAKGITININLLSKLREALEKVGKELERGE